MHSSAALLLWPLLRQPVRTAHPLSKMAKVLPLVIGVLLGAMLTFAGVNKLYGAYRRLHAAWKPLRVAATSTSPPAAIAAHPEAYCGQSPTMLVSP